MTENSRPWNGTVTGDAGPYSDADWHELYRNIIGLGAKRADYGVFLGSGDQPNEGLLVQEQSPAGAGVNVLPGSALIQGIAYLSDASESLAIAANASGNPRIDLVVLQADYALQTVRLVVKQGTPAVSPAVPVLSQTPNVIWEIPIADIAAANGFSTIVQANITPRQEWINAASSIYLDGILNNSGGELNTGDAVIWDSGANRAVTTTTRINDPRVVGVWSGRTANAGYGRVLQKGIGYVRTNAAVTRGNKLVSSSTVKQAQISTTVPGDLFLARALQTTSGAGLALCMVEGRGGGSRATIVDQKAENVDGGTSVNTTWTTRDLNTEIADPDGIVTINTNKFTPLAGVYRVYANSPFVSGVNLSAVRIRLRNVTAAAVLKVSSNYAMTIAVTGANPELEQVIIANGTDEFDVQYYMTIGARATDGLGEAIDETGASEIYTVIELELIGY